MAAFGFRGPPGALDGPYGYFHAFGDGYDSSFLERLGNASALAMTSFKPHSGCRHVHSGVDAALDLLNAGRPDLDQVTTIEVGTYKDAATPAFRVNPNPETADAAGYSLPAAVSTTLVRGSWYREDIEAFNDPAIRRLIPLVKVYVDEEMEASYPATKGCLVRVQTRDGAVYQGRVDYPKGEPENMLSDAEFQHKFSRLAGSLLNDDQMERIYQAVSRLERIQDVGELIRLTAP
jgi:2-methylcitrate dehydratase PrpD